MYPEVTLAAVYRKGRQTMSYFGSPASIRGVSSSQNSPEEIGKPSSDREQLSLPQIRELRSNTASLMTSPFISSAVMEVNISQYRRGALMKWKSFPSKSRPL